MEMKYIAKGQLISKANCQAVNSSKKWTNEFIFTSMRRFFEESSAWQFVFEINWLFRDLLTFKLHEKT